MDKHRFTLQVFYRRHLHSSSHAVGKCHRNIHRFRDVMRNVFYRPLFRYNHRMIDKTHTWGRPYLWSMNHDILFARFLCTVNFSPDNHLKYSTGIVCVKVRILKFRTHEQTDRGGRCERDIALFGNVCLCRRERTLQICSVAHPAFLRFWWK